ncbi:MAG: VgrG-related protein [Gemmatirosa sp.]
MPETAALLEHVYVEVDGMDATVAQELMGDLLETTVESSLHLPDVATLVLHDTRLRWIDDPRLEPGKGLRISAKASDGEHAIFDGEIVELEPDFGAGSQRLMLRAFDRLHRLSRGRRVRSFVNVTDGDLVRKIAQELGLRANVGPTSQVHDYVFQNNESNGEFLRRRAAALGFLLFADGQTLHCAPPATGEPPIEVKWAESLLEFHPRMTTAAQVTGATVRGWDPATRQEIVGQAGDGRGSPSIGERRTGGQLAGQAFALEAPYLTADRPVRSQAEADRLAQAVADRHAGAFVEADGACRGNSRVIAGCSVRVINVGDRFTGTYFVTSARHVFGTAEGYVTHFSVSGQQPATLLALLSPEPAPATASGLVIGIVTDNDDPDGLGRVKLKYPWLSPEHASHWARVAVPGGGADRGMQFLPEINDEVLVGFELGDVHHPYVIGGLWNGRDKPPGDTGKVVSGGKVEQRVIRSRTGHTITLDDSSGAPSITIEDRNGNVVHLDTRSDALSVRTKGDVKIEAKGSLSLKAQGRVEIAGMGVKIDGGAGTVDVKGSTINLN